MTGGTAWPLAGALVVVGILAGVRLGVLLRRAERLAEHSEQERAWTEYQGSRAMPIAGVEFYCRCGRREVVPAGSPPPTCEGVSCVGTEHEPRIMHDEARP